MLYVVCDYNTSLCHEWVIFFHSIHCSHAFLLPPQEVKGWYLGEQQHILGAEEGPRLLPRRFSYAVVTSELQIMHIFDLHSLFCDPGWFWWCLYSVLPCTFSTGLLHCSVTALIVSAYIKLCKRVYANILECWYIFAWYVTLCRRKIYSAGHFSYCFIMDCLYLRDKIALTWHWLGVHVWYYSAHA